MRRSSAHGTVQPRERPGKMHMQLQRMYHVVIHTSEQEQVPSFHEGKIDTKQNSSRGMRACARSEVAE